MSGDDWRLPGCGDGCSAWGHNPLAHEAYGRRSAAVAARVAAGRLVVDLARGRAYVGGREIDFGQGRRERELLLYLALRPGQTATYAEATRSLLGYADRDATENVQVIAVRLRRRLGEAGDRVVTVHGVGLRLDADEEGAA